MQELITKIPRPVGVERTSRWGDPTSQGGASPLSLPRPFVSRGAWRWQLSRQTLMAAKRNLDTSSLPRKTKSCRRRNAAAQSGAKEQDELCTSPGTPANRQVAGDSDAKVCKLVEGLGGPPLEKWKVKQLQAYLRSKDLGVTGLKESLVVRIHEYLRLKELDVKSMFPEHEFSIPCNGDVRQGDKVLFRHDVFAQGDCDIEMTGSLIPPIGSRTVVARVVEESHAKSRQNRTFTVEVLWTDGLKPLSLMQQLRMKGRNLCRHNTRRQPWPNEEERPSLDGKLVTESGDAAGAVKRATRSRDKTKPLQKKRASKKAGSCEPKTPTSRPSVRLAEDTEPVISHGAGRVAIEHPISVIKTGPVAEASGSPGGSVSVHGLASTGPKLSAEARGSPGGSVSVHGLASTGPKQSSSRWSAQSSITKQAGDDGAPSLKPGEREGGQAMTDSKKQIICCAEGCTKFAPSRCSSQRCRSCCWDPQCGVSIHWKGKASQSRSETGDNGGEHTTPLVECRQPLSSRKNPNHRSCLGGCGQAAPYKCMNRMCAFCCPGCPVKNHKSDDRY